MTKSNDKKRQAGLAERIYLALKNDIFDFRLMPGEHFSENEISERMAASRTPVRQALFWLEHEGYVQVYSRSGWQVKPFDFTYFEALYDFRIVLEMEAVKRLAPCRPPHAPIIWRRCLPLVRRAADAAGQGAVASR
jgi:DNA-binding GntR family transcriptional regulator